MKLLALDTATELCSAALWVDGAISTREVTRPRGHGELILPMIDALLAEAAVALGALDAIAFGRGPGAFTGVRLAASVAQGLAFAADLPLLPISDLRALAQQVFHEAQAVPRALICQDARMDEVYWACFECPLGHAELCGHEAVAKAEVVRLPPAWTGATVCGAGSGFAAYPQLGTMPGTQWAGLWPQLRPRAREIAELAAHEGVAAAVAPEQAQPVYLRDDVAARPSRN